MSARLRVCSSLRALFHVGAWCLDPGTHVLSFGHVTGFGHSRSIFCHCVCAVSSSLGTAHSCPRVFCCVARSSCFYRLRAFMLYLVLCGTQLVYSLAACFHVVMSCVNTWLMSFLISCVFMSCFAHGWWFVCCPCACVSVLWACGFCPSFLCATCSCQFVLIPPILLPVYWFIFPSCFPSLPSSFAPFIISLCLQFRVGSLPYVRCRLCPVQPCPARPCLLG